MNNIAAVESSIKFLLDKFEGRGCDSQGVSTCVRCNIVFLAKSVQAELDRSNTFMNHSPVTPISSPLGMKVCKPSCHSAAVCLYPYDCKADKSWEHGR